MELDFRACRSVLVVVPHEDDELNIAGGLLPLLVENGIEVKVLFMINGDFKVEAVTRYHEAREAMAAVGIPKEQVYFLGYPDVTDESAGQSLYRTEEAINSYLGNTSYGVPDIPEYRMMRDGVHSPCSYKGLCQDLEDFLLDMRCELILCIDFDHHHDHRLCTLAFEQTMEKILLTKGNTYVPEVYKCFAYSTAYEAPKDFYKLNLLPVPKPNKVRLSQAPKTELENPYYLWQNRVRFPVSAGCSLVPLKQNALYPAMQAYKSQLLIQTAQKMINSDLVAWKRETDYLAKLGKIIVTSGDGEALRKFSILDAKDISNFGKAEQPVEYIDRAWQPSAEDKKKAINYEFTEPIALHKITVYQGVNTWAKKLQVKVTLDNGFVLESQDFVGKSRTYKAAFTEQKNIKSLTVDFSATEEAFAITLVEFAVVSSKIQYAKIALDGNFAYGTYWLTKEKTLQLEAYKHDLEGQAAWKLDDKPVEAGTLDVAKLGKGKLDLFIDGQLRDSVVLQRISGFDVALRKLNWLWDKWSVYGEYKLLKRKHREIKRVNR